MRTHISEQSKKAESDVTSIGYRLLYFGLFACVISAPMAYVLIRMLPPSMLTQWVVVPLPRLSVEIQLLPPIQRGFELSAWITKTIASVVMAVIAWGGFLSMAGTVVGVAMFGGGMAVSRQPQTLFRVVNNLTEARGIRLLVVWYGLVVAVLTVPDLLRVLVEIFIILTVGGPLFVGLGIAWLRLRESQLVFTRIAVVYPLGVGVVLLPLVGVGLVSPTASATMQAVTLRLAVVILDTVLVVGGLNDWLRATFQLAGVNSFLMWVGVVTVVGWIVGSVAELRS